MRISRSIDLMDQMSFSDVATIPDESAQEICSNCGTGYSPVWHYVPQNTVLCNACGLYWKKWAQPRPLTTEANRKSCRVKAADPAAEDAAGQDGRRRASERAARRRHLASKGCSLESERSRLRRKGSTPVRAKTERPALYSTGIMQYVNGKRMTAPISDNKDGIQYCLYRGVRYMQGDYVGLLGKEGKVYFAVIESFSTDTPDEPMFAYYWLVPKDDAPIGDVSPSSLQVREDLKGSASLDQISMIVYSPGHYRPKLTPTDAASIVDDEKQ